MLGLSPTVKERKSPIRIKSSFGSRRLGKSAASTSAASTSATSSAVRLSSKAAAVAAPEEGAVLAQYLASVTLCYKDDTTLGYVNVSGRAY